MATPILSILTFPQNLVGDTLSFNILVIPRNVSPLLALTPGAPSFATANLQLQAKVITSLGPFPSDLVSPSEIPLTGIGIPAAANDIFTYLGGQFDTTSTKTAASVPLTSIKKYLPLSYRNAFNFTNPRSPQLGVTDDSYECAIKGAKHNPAFQQSDGTVSWGQVFAYLLRTPDLARAVGFIQTGSITITADMFKNGGWLYVDLAPGSDFYAQEQLDDTLVKKYAARIPALTIGSGRNIFAALQFPVLTASNSTPVGNYDQIFIEASEYDTGFAKIVHAFQPVNGNMLVETEDPESLPRKDVGVRLGWDDEQLLIWQNRQVMEDPDNPGSGQRVDAPLGVSKYRIDVRLSVPSGQTPNPWSSLSMVTPVSPLTLGATPIPVLNDPFELGTEVYPSQIGGDSTSNFWLPSYFTQWTGTSLVLPDTEAALLFKTDKALPGANPNFSGQGVQLPNIYNPVGLGDPALLYGNTYDFRVRLADHTGGGPATTDEPDPLNEGPAPVSTLPFKRYIAPQAVIWPHTPINGVPFTGKALKIWRPRLGYPAVVFTGKYNDPITLLTKDADKAASDKATGKTGRDFGLPDPDVTHVEILVEVKSLLMDNQLSINGREAYVPLYTTLRKFTPGPVGPGGLSDYDTELEIKIEYRDAAKPLNLGTPNDLSALGLAPGDIDTIDQIVLPTSRSLRITMKAVCPQDNNYFGSSPIVNFNEGLPTAFFARQESTDETGLISGTGAENQLQGIYLQPDADPIPLSQNTITKVLFGDLNSSNPPDMLQRLSGQMGVANKGFTLVGKAGKQVQFGCAQAIRHSLSPDNSNITFSTKAELLNHWIVVLDLVLNRDWAWDALKYDSFLVQRVMKFSADGPITASDVPQTVGYIRLGTSANFVALQNPDRTQSDLYFIDAVEPKPLPGKFPDTIQLRYTVTPQFVAKVAPKSDPPLVLDLELPVTTPPAQIPALASAGIALSPYKELNNYSATEPREKYLWLEFEQAPEDPNDSFFIRLLNYAPDPLLSKFNLDMITNTQEPSLPIDPELIRVISSGNDTDDEAGLDAMQLMVPSEKSRKHFLIPLPPGLNSASPELFGLFTYEIRAGHYMMEYSSTPGETLWSTAQGRFGRPLRITGVQHPAPGLFCIVNRDEVEIRISAPHAMAVLNGVNVTAKPPKTRIWALLYAQVMQADGRKFRNILLGDRMLTPILEHDKEKERINKDAPVYSACKWLNGEVYQMLAIMGLPLDSSVSVLCVEMMPKQETYLSIPEEFFEAAAVETSKQAIAGYMKMENADFRSGVVDDSGVDDPLGKGLGHFRILRTSPLTAVPFVCCTNC